MFLEGDAAFSHPSNGDIVCGMSLERARWDVVVVGGGLVGCSVARTLAAAGRTVAVVERGRPASEASWAAAGMLSPLGEAPEAGPFLSLALESLERWPSFAAALEEETGVPLGFHLTGKLLLAFGEAEEEALRARRRWQAAAGFDVRWLEGPAVLDIEPCASSEAAAALHLPGEGQVDNRALGEALWRAAEAAGCRFLLGREAAAVTRDGGRVRGVRLSDGTALVADAVVIAAGAWSGALAGLPRPLPLRPVLGQMLALRPPRPLLRGVLAAPGAYVVPRGSEAAPRILVGATVEEVGFRRGTTPGALAGLFRSATRALPALADAPVVETWSGLRPGTPDDLPVLGPDPEVEGLHYATGHFRNGVLLSPVTAVRVASGVEGNADPGAFAPFRPDRFPEGTDDAS